MREAGLLAHVVVVRDAHVPWLGSGRQLGVVRPVVRLVRPVVRVVVVVRGAHVLAQLWVEMATRRACLRLGLGLGLGLRLGLGLGVRLGLGLVLGLGLGVRMR